LSRAVRFLLSIALAFLAVNLPATEAQPLPQDDAVAAASSAFAAAQHGVWARAYAEAAAIKDPLPIKLLHWMDYSRSGGPASFAEITDFIAHNPDWPGLKGLRKHAEQVAKGEPDATVADWLRRYPPVSGVGRERQAEILFNNGDAAGGTAALRSVWTEADFGPTDEKEFLARHGDAIRSEDDVVRLDRLLWDGRNEAARRLLPRVSPDYRALAEARLALAAMAPNAETLAGKVPSPLLALSLIHI